MSVRLREALKHEGESLFGGLHRHAHDTVSQGLVIPCNPLVQERHMGVILESDCIHIERQWIEDEHQGHRNNLTGIAKGYGTTGSGYVLTGSPDHLMIKGDPADPELVVSGFSDNGLRGEVVSITPHVTAGFMLVPRVDFLLIVEKLP